MLDSETVETASSTPDHSARNNLAARIGWAILILATLYVCYFSHLGAIGFVGPDEPRYAWIARDMAETGDWTTPRLYGKPWFEKPPLFYWGAALCFKLFGVSEAAARLPSAISALLATLALAWLAFRLYGAETARWLLLLLPTTVGMIGFSHAASTDMPFSAMLTIAMVCAAVVLGLTRNENSPIIPQTPWFALILFGFFLALAVLAKGPAGIILVGGAVFFWALFTKRWRDSFRLFHPAALASFFATALPWYILCARRNPDFFRIFILEHNFKRYLTPEFQHIQPIWYYIPILLLAFLPWTLGFLVWFFKSKQVDKGPAADGQRNSYFLSFGLFPMLFFSISRSKLPGYLLPAMAPLTCLLVARIAEAVHLNSRSKQMTLLLLALTSLGLGIAGERFASHRILGADIIPAPWTGAVWLPLLLAGVVAAILVGFRRDVVSLCVLQVGVLLAILGLARGLVWMDPQLSARGVLEVTHVPLQSVPANKLFVHDLTRGMRYGLNFYLRREIPQWTQETKVGGLVFTSLKGQQELKAAGYSCKQHIVYPAAILCDEKRDDSSGRASP
jgi:4-amino-4-deoxy-L-arabinose transferase-like glycosyltransferase